MRTNKKAVDKSLDVNTRLAGGHGALAAKQDAEGLLRRAVLACLLWEDNAYEDGESVASNIKKLIPLVDPLIVADIAIEARMEQKLRHVPLFIAREMARLDTHKYLVGKLLPIIIQRADELTEFLALYWKEGRQPISKQVKVGLAEAFLKFDEYSLAKYNRKTEVKLKDVMQLVHPNPSTAHESNIKSDLLRRLNNNDLRTPDTWEVALSTGADKKSTWERLITEGKLGALAFLRNLRNMGEAHVSKDVIKYGFSNLSTRWLLPINFLAAAKYAPKWEKEIEEAMLRGLSQLPKLPGHSILVVDVSGSMYQTISNKSEFNRLDAAAAMALLAREMCEKVSIYATAGNDVTCTHRTVAISDLRGFALADKVNESIHELGGGGIFTRQCLEYIHKVEVNKPARIIVFSDSQDCDHPHLRTPNPFGYYNYIIDVSSVSRGINYNGRWTAELSGWSEHFLRYIYAIEDAERNNLIQLKN